MILYADKTNEHKPTMTHDSGWRLLDAKSGRAWLYAVCRHETGFYRMFKSEDTDALKNWFNHPERPWKQCYSIPETAVWVGHFPAR